MTSRARASPFRILPREENAVFSLRLSGALAHGMELGCGQIGECFHFIGHVTLVRIAMGQSQICPIRRCLPVGFEQETLQSHAPSIALRGNPQFVKNVASQRALACLKPKGESPQRKPAPAGSDQPRRTVGQGWCWYGCSPRPIEHCPADGGLTGTPFGQAPQRIEVWAPRRFYINFGEVRSGHRKQARRMFRPQADCNDLRTERIRINPRGGYRA